MLETFYDYFREIEMASALQERAEQLCNEFARLMPSPIEKVFVTDLYDPQGVRRYQNLEMVGRGIWMECKNFLVSDNMDFLNMNCGVKWVQIDKTELKGLYGETSTKSTVRATVVFEGSGPAGQLFQGTGALLHAVHNNCPRLVDFVQEELLTRLNCRVGERGPLLNAGG
jgi:hypothetical protein